MSRRIDLPTLLAWLTILVGWTPLLVWVVVLR